MPFPEPRPAHSEIHADAVPPSNRPPSRPRGGASRSRSGLRRTFFSLAALWGFALGSLGILGTSAVMGEPLELRGWLVATLVAALILTVFGGLFAAAAYRRVVRRRGG